MTENTVRSGDQSSQQSTRCFMSASWPARTFAFVIMVLTGIYPLSACGNQVTMQDSSIKRDAATSQPQSTVATSTQGVPVYTYEVINSWPHDTKAFTQGLVFHMGVLYESTGHYGSSTLRKIDLHKGQVTKTVDIDPQCFAEGITVFQEKIYQLTWTEHKAFVYDLKNLRIETEIPYEGEGWGLTDDGHQLIMSDGTNKLRFLDPVTFKTTRAISVMDNDKPLMDLNELEFIKGEIYANIWKSERIARIDPHNGKLLGWIDLTGLHPLVARPNSEDVLNGIAYDENDDRLFVTGKRWPKIFEIRLKPKT